MSPEQKSATLEALRLTGDYHSDNAVWCKEQSSSLVALIAAAFSASPMTLAEDALEQLSCELTVFGEVLDTGINPAILNAVVTGMADRARVAAELSRRISEANSHGQPAPSEATESEAAQ